MVSCKTSNLIWPHSSWHSRSIQFQVSDQLNCPKARHFVGPKPEECDGHRLFPIFFLVLVSENHSLKNLFQRRRQTNLAYIDHDIIPLLPAIESLYVVLNRSIWLENKLANDWLLHIWSLFNDIILLSVRIKGINALQLLSVSSNFFSKSFTALRHPTQDTSMFKVEFKSLMLTNKALVSSSFSWNV